MKSERLQAIFKASHNFLDGATGLNTNAFGKRIS